MVVGTLGAIGNGVSEPLISVLFGNVINSFGESTNSTILRSVTKAVLNFIYLGIGTAVASFLQVSCWTMAGERQSARIRSFYLKSVLRQDIAFFDTEMTTGEAVSRMSSDTVIIQDALGEKAGKLVQLTSAFFGGFVIAFTRGWLLTLVMLTSLPLVAIAGAVSAQMLTRVSSKRLTSYSDAADTVEQTIGSIRTVVSFNGEKKAIATYNNFIKKAYKTVIEEGLINGFGMGSVFCILFSSYGLAFWYGGKLIIDKGYNGGKIMTVLFAVLTGATSLGNATPSISAIAEGQSAAYRLFETIERRPKIDSDDTSGMVLENIKGDVELKDVYFRYPARPGQLILDGLSLQVVSGTTMAIVGESGSEYFLFGIAGGKLIERVRTLSFQNIVRQEVAWFDNPSNSSGALGTRLSVDALNVRRLVGDNLAVMVQSAAALITGFVIAFTADWRLALVITCVIPLVGIQGYAQVKYLKGFSEESKVFFALVLAVVGVSQASALASNATKARDSAISVFSILDRKSKIDTISGEGLMLENVTGDIDFTNVSFKYPSRPDVQIFSDFTLHIPSRKTIALVGESGSGKSTIIALLERFYDPDSGRISLDGVEIKSLIISWLRDQMGLVGQEPVLFNGTIRANITYGKHGEVTEEEVTAVAKAANAHDFISSLPQGYDTLVGEKGVQLSGGQKHLDEEVWDVRFHLDGKDNLERQLGRSDITYMNLLAMLEIEGYGWGDSMYYVREEGAGIAGMALIKSMVNVEEMLAQYESAQCVSITVIKGKSGLPAGINMKQCEEQIPISKIGVPVVYSVDMQGVLFGSQHSNENEDDNNYHLVHVDTEQDYVLTQQSQVPVIPIDSDDDDLNEKIIDLKKKRPAETFNQVENYSEEEDLFNDSDMESEDSGSIIETEKKVKKPRTGPTTRSHYGEASTNLPDYLPSSGEDTNYVDDLASGYQGFR
ncbi:hypothetical protein ACQ4PT_006954 [Festuca glaucescens]